MKGKRGALKRGVVIIGMIVFFLVGCVKDEESSKEIEEVEVEETHEEIEKEIQQFVVDPSSFHYVVDWLTDEEILFVEKEGKKYHLKTFNIDTKSIRMVYEEQEIVTDVLIHPSRTDLLVQTASSSESATVKRVTLEGVVQSEVTVESTELAVDWNDVDASFMILTAFYEDWSFDSFFFDGTTNELILLQTESPFPKWLGTEYLVLSNLDETVMIYDIQTGEKKTVNESNIASFDTFKESLLIVHSNDEEKMIYSLLNQSGETLKSWETAFSRDDMMLNPPVFEWLDETSFLALQPVENGQAVNPIVELVKYEEAEETVLMSDLVNSELACSPNHEKCMVGYSFEEIVDLKKRKTFSWLQLAS